MHALFSLRNKMCSLVRACATVWQPERMVNCAHNVTGSCERPLSSVFERWNRRLWALRAAFSASARLVPAIALSFAMVHPIEMLRAVARSRMAPPGKLAAEAAWGLGALASEEPAAVLPACRRLLERQPGCGPLWWVCARILTAADPAREADSCATLLLEDRTPRVLRSALKSQKGEGTKKVGAPGGIGEVASADVVVVEVSSDRCPRDGRAGLAPWALGVRTGVWNPCVGRVRCRPAAPSSAMECP